jgi:hypothetical protein
MQSFEGLGIFTEG